MAARLSTADPWLSAPALRQVWLCHYFFFLLLLYRKIRHGVKKLKIIITEKDEFAVSVLTAGQATACIKGEGGSR